ncbi:MAG TPA: helix-turn-helix domain-containing protein, partial [Polyangiaceae bacterium]|nr:helix-turn-helix domain-containing protein [Polyangiaceae bacterium]
MGRPSDTRERILAAARDLFIAHGVQQTSLRDIAERLGISKPALYYHFDSRDALLESIVLPLIDNLNEFIAVHEAVQPRDARLLLEDYFELLRQHREVLTLLVRDLSTLGALGLGTRLLVARRRLIALLSGPEAA